MTLIIAEAGINHNGDLGIAKLLIDTAKDVGANCVKFQTYRAEILEPPGERRDMLRRYQLSERDHFELKAHAEEVGIEMISTPFDVDSLIFLRDDLKLSTIKIASGFLDHADMLDEANRGPSHLIVSTGMSRVGDIAKALKRVPRARLLHCVSAYPAPIKEMNLRVIPMLARTFGDRIGLSDHTTTCTVPFAAVALGAKIIEKHLTLDQNMEGPDHKSSIMPKQFRGMVQGIRAIEKALGSAEKGPQLSEEGTIQILKERHAHRHTG